MAMALLKAQHMIWCFYLPLPSGVAAEGCLDSGSLFKMAGYEAVLHPGIAGVAVMAGPGLVSEPIQLDKAVKEFLRHTYIGMMNCVAALFFV
ncbi:hypothetical protein B0J13DRAFT_312957 [Dactylonectria estremocensis]|uniref:Uncharacterized protein n=1 Tax=Dactylonectria estremocensis TaxID=1079267 RepID=A0A9P9EZX8_9HYPO|nr:hypothetical protein B0J13DRAFT_312957 [Dactylonectria estremocensis]